MVSDNILKLTEIVSVIWLIAFCAGCSGNKSIPNATPHLERVEVTTPIETQHASKDAEPNQVQPSNKSVEKLTPDELKLAIELGVIQPPPHKQPITEIPDEDTRGLPTPFPKDNPLHIAQKPDEQALTTCLNRKKYEYIQFEQDKFTLAKTSEETLNHYANILKVGGKCEISVVGHTDASGSASYNLNLSKRRAETVVRYLIKRGVNGQHLKSEGKGKSELLYKHDPENPKNRRVEIINNGPIRSTDQSSS